MSQLLTLPLELQYEIADHLPADAILALKLTHPILNENLSLEAKFKKEKVSTCARFAIRTYLSKPDSKPSHKRCILCKAVYPTEIFSSSSSPACLPVSISVGQPRPEVVELPDRFCAWHVGRLAKIVQTEKEGRNEWVSQIRQMCMHCGSLEGWGECICKCDSCGTKSVRTYTRYLNNSIECKKFHFWRSAQEEDSDDGGPIAGKLHVRESCLDPDATESRTVINLPVHFENEPSGDEITTKPPPSELCRPVTPTCYLPSPPDSPRN